MAHDNATEIGISKTYNITLPGREPYAFTGTPDAVWKHIESAMAGRAGTPHIEEVIDPDSTPEATETVAAAREDLDREQRRADNTQRSHMDLLALQASGFTPARPFYDRGTPVNSWGVDNARQSRRDFDDMRGVAREVDAFVDQIKSEQRSDVLVPATDLVMRKDGTLVGPDGVRWGVEQHAISQIASRLGIEQPAMLHTVWPELRATIWNQHIATARGHEASTCPAGHPVRERLAPIRDKQILCRTRKSVAQGCAADVFAGVSERYATYDVDQIAQAAAHGFRDLDGAKCEISYNGHGFQMDVLFHTNVQPEDYVAGEFFKTGVRVKSDDAGKGGLTISTLAWQNLCLNLILIDVAEFRIDALRHLGNTDNLAARFRKAVQKAQAKLDHFLRAWGYATGDVLCEPASNGYKPEHVRLLDELDGPVSETDMLVGLFKGLGKTGAVSIGKNDLPGLLAAHAKDQSGAVTKGPITRASIVNAITRHAHENVGRINPAKESELEREAGALLVSARGNTPLPLPFLPPPRERETVAAR